MNITVDYLRQMLLRVIIHDESGCIASIYDKEELDKLLPWGADKACRISIGSILEIDGIKYKVGDIEFLSYRAERPDEYEFGMDSARLGESFPFNVTLVIYTTQV